jgi:Glutathione S-transferase, N-terminal domain
MLRLYGSARSRGVRTLWMLGELGLPYEHRDYLPRSAVTKTPEYRALNPNGAVPTIDDDGFVLCESMAINLYLAKKAGKLYPIDAKSEAGRSCLRGSILVGRRLCPCPLSVNPLASRAICTLRPLRGNSGRLGPGFWWVARRRKRACVGDPPAF